VIFGRALLLAAPFLLVACSATDPRCAALPDVGTYCLQATTAVAPFAARQKVEVSFDARRETMIVQIEVDSEKMRFAGLTPFGLTLIEADYDNRAPRAEKMPADGFDAAALFSLLQIALWPLDAVRAGFTTAPVEVNDAYGVRSIFAEGEEAFRVRRVGDAPPFDEIEINYPSLRAALRIRTLDSDDRGQNGLSGIRNQMTGIR
jgi:hypothetical protein